jgi:AAA+ ATPase superfamily predicted ATPase
MKPEVENPFLVTGYISPEYFCDREQETARLVSNIVNGRNTALLSDRRMGKTGLIEHVFHTPEISRNYHTFLVDIYPAGTLREFVFLLGKYIFETLKPRGQRAIDRFIATISSLRTAVRIDPMTGVPSFDLSLGEIRQPETSLEEIFRYLESADKPCVVAIDEFQQVARFAEKNVEAILRTIIQRGRNTHFIFSGSAHHMMRDIFFTHSRPFYQSVVPMTLGPIDEGKYTDFVTGFFEKAGVKITPDDVGFVYRFLEGHTWYMQAVFNEIFPRVSKGTPVDKKMLVHALDDVVWIWESTFQNMIVNLADRQKEVLIAIAKNDDDEAITSAEFIRRNGLPSASSVQAAVRQLVAKEVVVKTGNRYTIPDRFFRMWLQMVYGRGVVIKDLSMTLWPRG